jgi:hypothetical protein
MMKPAFIFLIIALVTGACSAPGSKQESRDTTDTAKSDLTAYDQRDIGPRELCFIHTEGDKKQDTTLVHLVISGYIVNGFIEKLPITSNGQKGPVYGKKTGNIIKVTWTFKKGAATDSLKTAFKLSGNKLLQQPIVTNAQNGTQPTDTTAKYTIIYNRADCKKLGITIKF